MLHSKSWIVWGTSLLFFWVLSLTLQAQQQMTDDDMLLLDGFSLDPLGLTELTHTIKPGTIVVIGEIHDSHRHHLNQILLLRELISRLPDPLSSISVGMEFFSYPSQSYVDQYLAGELEEQEFLSLAGWGGNPFELYREQVLFPNQTKGRTIALNAPRELSSFVAQHGLSQLTEELQALMPPHFEGGNDLYRQRFLSVMQQHSHGNGHDPMAAMDEEQENPMERFFIAQSIWDDTMAWKAVSHMQEHPRDVLIIIVGDFHVAYGGGLPDRIRQRGYPNLITISQVNIQGLTEEEEKELLSPHPVYGKRADYIMVER